MRCWSPSSTSMSASRRVRRGRGRLVLFAVGLLLAGPLQADEGAPRPVLEWVEEEDADGRLTGYRLLADNPHVIPWQVRITFDELVGLDADRSLPLRTVVPAGAEGRQLLRLARTGAGRASFQSSFSFTRGDPGRARHDDSHRYLFPFAHGQGYRVTQGYHGPSTHQGANAYAIDFDMAEGEPIHAARGGLVAETRADATEGGTALRFLSEDSGNYIVVAHDDGSFATYAHLRPGGVHVEVGERVAAGDHIGDSGNTGYSTGPHLHFDVRVPTRALGLKSVPTRFRDHQGRVVTPQTGRFYYAAHPGKPAFDIILGEELRNADFVDFRAEVTSGELGVRSEKWDDTVVLFLSNGTEQRLDVTAELQLERMEATTPLTVSRVVEPQTEVFLSIIRPRQGARSYRYGYHLGYREVAD